MVALFQKTVTTNVIVSKEERSKVGKNCIFVYILLVLYINHT